MNVTRKYYVDKFTGDRFILNGAASHDTSKPPNVCGVIIDDDGIGQLMIKKMPPQIELCASLMCADYRRLGAQIRELDAAGIDRYHLDVFDGHFVSNFGL